ncbi:MAG: hypothetical protein OEZ06_31050 [Myxococcales bacterium]|nr:hypothetical protein [Myxococcales bacterium]
MEHAAGEVELERDTDEARAAIVRAHRRGFGHQVVDLAFVNAIVAAIDRMTGPGAFYHWGRLGSAVMLGARLIRNLMPTEADLQRAEKRIQKRRKARERRKHRSQHERGSATGEHIERVVEEGVEALLHAAADRTEDYNRRRRGAGRKKVRVEEEAEQHGASASASQRTRCATGDRSTPSRLLWRPTLAGQLGHQARW